MIQHLNPPEYCDCRGHHRWSMSGSGLSYCLDCGEPRTSTAVDWSEGVKPPGPVKFPTREEAMADARRLRWQVLPAEVIFPRVVLITRPIRANNPEYGWLLQRLQPGESPFIHGLRATHWSEDIVGHP